MYVETRWAKLLLLCIWPLSALASLWFLKLVFEFIGLVPMVVLFISLFSVCYLWPTFEQAGTAMKIRRRTSTILSKGL